MSDAGETTSADATAGPPGPPGVSLSAENDADWWRTLLLFIERGEVVPIVGRDLLAVGQAGSRTHLYDPLAADVARRLNVEPAIPTATNPLNDVACRYLARPDSDPREIYLKVYEAQEAMQPLGLPEALLELASIDKFKLFLTTTFDDSLKRAIDQVRFNGLPQTEVLRYTRTETEDLQTSIAKLARPVVFHLLGQVAPTDDYVVTEEDALEFLHALHLSRPVKLFEEMYRKDLLVIGCRFPNWLVRSFIRLARPERLRQTRSRTVFVVDTGAREDRALVDFLKAFRTRTEVIERPDPIEFVHELHRRWNSRQAPAVAVAAATRPEPKAIFISYASEDAETARAVATALQQAKLDVWLDRDQLMAGDDFERRIEENIGRSGLFLPILSQRSAIRGPRFFRLEWKHALRRADLLGPSIKSIFPVVIDDLAYTNEAIDSALRQLHWFSLRGGLTAEFVDAVKKHYIEHQW